jgi:hypothetical protein
MAMTQAIRIGDDRALKAFSSNKVERSQAGKAEEGM